MSTAEIEAKAAGRAGPTDDPGFPEHRITVDRYRKMVEAGVFGADEPIFLWDGKLVEEMTKGDRHNFAVAGLTDWLVKLAPDGWFVRVEMPVSIAPTCLPEPDLVVARGDRRDYLGRPFEPRDAGLCVEVADSSLAADSEVKRPAYARAGVPIFWLVNIPEGRVEVHEGPTGEGYARRTDYRPGESVPVVLDGVRVGEVAVSEILPG